MPTQSTRTSNAQGQAGQDSFEETRLTGIEYTHQQPRQGGSPDGRHTWPGNVSLHSSKSRGTGYTTHGDEGGSARLSACQFGDLGFSDGRTRTRDGSSSGFDFGRRSDDQSRLRGTSGTRRRHDMRRTGVLDLAPDGIGDESRGGGGRGGECRGRVVRERHCRGDSDKRRRGRWRRDTGGSTGPSSRDHVGIGLRNSKHPRQMARLIYDWNNNLVSQGTAIKTKRISSTLHTTSLTTDRRLVQGGALWDVDNERICTKKGLTTYTRPTNTAYGERRPTTHDNEEKAT